MSGDRPTRLPRRDRLRPRVRDDAPVPPPPEAEDPAGRSLRQVTEEAPLELRAPRQAPEAWFGDRATLTLHVPDAERARRLAAAGVGGGGLVAALVISVLVFLGATFLQPPQVELPPEPLAVLEAPRPQESIELIAPRVAPVVVLEPADVRITLTTLDVFVAGRVTCPGGYRAEARFSGSGATMLFPRVPPERCQLALEGSGTHHTAVTAGSVLRCRFEGVLTCQ